MLMHVFLPHLWKRPDWVLVNNKQDEETRESFTGKYRRNTETNIPNSNNIEVIVFMSFWSRDCSRYITFVAVCVQNVYF